MNGDKIKILKQEFINNLKNLLLDLKNMDQDFLKSVNFLFGAGFNNNISNNADSWDSMVFKSLVNYLKKNQKSTFETKALANELTNLIGNKKILLSITKEENIKIEKIRLNDSNFRFQMQEDLARIKEKFFTTFYTLNYDTLVEDMLDIDSWNLLEQEKVNNKKVNHLHGLLKNANEMSKEKLLTMTDYLNNKNKVIKIIKNNLLEIDKSKSAPFLFILGCSMQEEHILEALRIKSANNQKVRNIKIIWFTYLPNEKYIVSRIEEEYRKLSINVINYNIFEEKDHHYNFKFMWTEFVKFIMDYKFAISTYSSIDKIDINKYISQNTDVEKLLDDLEKGPPKKINQVIDSLFIFKKINIEKVFELKRKYPEILKMDFLYHKLKNVDKSIIIKYLETKESDIKKFRTSYKGFPEELSEILKESKMEYLLENKEFKKLATQSIIFDLCTLKTPNIYAYRNVAIDFELILKKRLYLEFLPDDECYKPFIKLLEKHFDKRLALSIYKKPTIESLIKLLKDESLKFGKEYLILQTKRWKKFLDDNFDNLINYYQETDFSNKRYLFNLLYFTCCESKKYREKYMNFVENQNDFLKYPDFLAMAGQSTNTSPKFSWLDGEYIKNPKPFKDIQEAEEFVKTNNISSRQIKGIFFTKVKGILIPHKGKIEFVRRFIDLWDRVNGDYRRHINGYLSFDLKLETIEEIYQIGIIIQTAVEKNKRKIYPYGYPLVFRDRRIEYNFTNQWRNCDDFQKISIEDYEIFFFIQTNSGSYASGYHLGECWFKKGIEIAQENKQIEILITKELKKYIKSDDQLIKCIKEQDFSNINIKNWDYLYFQFKYDLQSMNEKNVILSLKNKGSLIQDTQIAEVIKSFIYSKKLYEDIQKLEDFTKKIKKIENIPETIKLVKKIKIYCLCHYKEKDDFKSQGISFQSLSETLDHILAVTRDYYEEMNSDVLAEFIRHARKNDEIFGSYIEPFWLIEDIELSTKIKEVIKERLESQILAITNEQYINNYSINRIKDFLKKQAIEISKKSQKILEQKLN